MPDLDLSSIDEIANLIIIIIRVVLGARMTHCLIVLMFKKPEHGEQIKNRMKNMAIAWIIAETIKDLLPKIINYYN